MWWGAIVKSGIAGVVIGAMNPQAGCAGSILDILNMKEFNHQVEKTLGVGKEESEALLKEFFTELRIRNKDQKRNGNDLA
jgi:tRNA(adenine34) deaminase